MLKCQAGTRRLPSVGCRSGRRAGRFLKGDSSRSARRVCLIAEAVGRRETWPRGCAGHLLRVEWGIISVRPATRGSRLTEDHGVDGVWTLTAVVFQQWIKRKSGRWSIPARFLWGSLDSVPCLCCC